jgi:membrane fusion protein, copper/silver efflux system
MRPIFAVLAGVGGLVVGVAATWLLTHPASDAAKSAASSAPASTDKKVLYWYDPMVPDQHFGKPGKSPFMDMQLVPKVAGDTGDGAGVVQIDPRQVQNLGLRTAKVARGALQAIVRATGTVAFDERTVTVVQARVAGIVERLDVRAPLTAVKQGQALLTLLAPDWTAAQEEYLSLRRARSEGLGELREAARRRLLLLGMGEGQIRAIERSGQSQARITITAPRDGVVGELSVREGATVMAGSPLLRINGLDTVWINAAIPEAQISRVTSASSVQAELPAFPGERFEGRIDALLPDIDATTRTQTARIVLRNPEHRLAPGMFAQVEFADSKDKPEGMLIPSEAVIATGTRSVVIVAEGDGRFRAQEVRTGDEAEGKTEVLDGLKEGDNVVLSGQFLIDSEASLTGTLARLGGGEEAPTQAEAAAKQDTAAHTAYTAEGTLKRIDGDRWTIATEAIPALDMGAMTMMFVRPAQSTVDDIRLGQRVSFSFFRNFEGYFEIERITAIDHSGEALTPPHPSGNPS